MQNANRTSGISGADSSCCDLILVSNSHRGTVTKVRPLDMV